LQAWDKLLSKQVTFIKEFIVFYYLFFNVIA